MKHITRWLNASLCSLAFLTSCNAGDRAQVVITAVESGHTNRLDGLVGDADSRRRVIERLVVKVNIESDTETNIFERGRALRALIALKAPEAADLLLDWKTSWVKDDPATRLDGNRPVSQDPDVLALIHIGAPSIRAIMSDRCLGAKAFGSMELGRYSAAIVGICGYEGARVLIDNALQTETREPARSNLIALDAIIDHFIERGRE